MSNWSESERVRGAAALTVLATSCFLAARNGWRAAWAMGFPLFRRFIGY
ncbi:MAG: hypothetical protein JO187_10095 [Acidobacteria bacterium]|nr:hypothetical protein [Acidobacteriaceae bacterium]MBV9609896.1 hypothetical protein [Acidobacteriota bacterium]